MKKGGISYTLQDMHKMSLKSKYSVGNKTVIDLDLLVESKNKIVHYNIIKIRA